MEQIRVATQPERIDHFMRTFIPDIILLDMNFNGMLLVVRRFLLAGEDKEDRPGRGGSFL